MSITIIRLIFFTVVSLFLFNTYADDFNGDGRSDIVFHKPGGSWNTVPTLFSNGEGSWFATNIAAPTWAHQAGVVAITGDYNGDGRTDVAFHKPGGTWNTVPILFSNGEGSWFATNLPAPTWAHESGVIAIAGDYNGDGRSDIAFHRPGSSWSTVPTLFSFGNGVWIATNIAAPTWAHQADVVAIPGDYNGDGRSDIAFHRPGSSWGTVPTLFSNGEGSWFATNLSAPTWAHSAGVVAVPGDYNGDGRSDIIFHRPDSGWNTVPTLFSNGEGSWFATNLSAPTWAHQPGVVAIAGDFNGDGRSDVAFHRPGASWNTVPTLFSNGEGSWFATNLSAPTWAHQSGVIAIAGDFNGDGRSDVAFHKPGGSWNTVPTLFSNGEGSWFATNLSAPTWAHQADVIAVK